MKELLRKKSVKISLLLIILLVVMGIVGINVRSAQRNKEYDAHIAAAEKYLSELDYEQAIAEYTMAYEIDPKEEVVDALEQTYLAYAQTCINAGDYEKAVSILEEGYEKIGRESLQNKIEEFQVIQEEMRAKEAQLQEQKRLEEEQRRIEEEQRASGMVEFPFKMADITVMGYDLYGDHFVQLEELLLAKGAVHWLKSGGEYPMGIGHTSDGWTYQIETSTSGSVDTMYRSIVMYNSEEANGWVYDIEYRNDDPHACLIILPYYDGRVSDYAGINVPITAGESYEDWCRVMQINQIKENNLRPEERDGRIGIWKDDVLICGVTTPVTVESCEYWFFSTEWFQGIYSEYNIGGGVRECILDFSKTSIYEGREERPINCIYATIKPDGVIEKIYYVGRPITE